MAEINWTEINAKLPTGRDAGSKARRQQMFRDFDNGNGNGILSLAEVDKSIRDILGVNEMFDAKLAIMRAFQIAKDSTQSKRLVGADYIELREFKLLLVSLRQYFEYWVAFRRTGSDGDKQINMEEFKAAQEKIEVWVRLVDIEREFANLDTNGGGSILFNEFCAWDHHEEP